MLERKASTVSSAKERSRDRLISDLMSGGITNRAVLEAIARVPRHLFVEEGLAHSAYEDTTLPIGEGQTISQPTVVATMTQAVYSSTRFNTVLEIGTGCGYQTAILAQLAKRVCTIERIGALQVTAEQRLRRLGFRNIEYRHGDGFVGWKERAPFDAIVVTAGATELPTMLPTQLAQGGKLIIPIGHTGSQKLHFIRNVGGRLQEEALENVAFVPLLRGYKE